MTTPSGSACVPCRSSETTFCVVTVLILALLAESLDKENGLWMLKKCPQHGAGKNINHVECDERWEGAGFYLLIVFKVQVRP